MITILTPTYNRGEYYLERLYHSLQNQRCHQFEWIIVDDGSTDGTDKIVDRWQDDDFAVIYLYQENAGKHVAVNCGVYHASGEFIFIVDSDDYLLPDAVELILKWTKEIDGDKRFAGVSGLRGYSAHKAIGKRPTKDYVDCSNLERKKYSLTGDKAEVYRTELLRKYPFPVFKGEKYIPEDVVWNAIARDGYILRWHNRIIYIGEYLAGGLTMGGRQKDRRMEFFKGYTYREKQNVKIQKGIEKYMELGRYIDLVKKKGVKEKTFYFVKRTLKISVEEYVVGYICYIIRKYGKKIRGRMHGRS